MLSIHSTPLTQIEREMRERCDEHSSPFPHHVTREQMRQHVRAVKAELIARGFAGVPLSHVSDADWKAAEQKAYNDTYL